MNNKKGFSLFGKKNKELPNQSNELQNINTEQNNMIQSSLPTEAPVEKQISTNEQNSFANIPTSQEIVNTNLETNIFNTTPDIQSVNNIDSIQPLINNDFSRNVSEFSSQETEQSIENQLASESSIQLPKQPELMTAPTLIEEAATKTQETPAQPQPEPGTINALNNLGTYNMDSKENTKKEINKKTFIIIAGVLALLLCLTGLVTGSSSKLFGKAPNEIIVPGENEEEPSHKVDNPEEDKEISKEDENEEFSNQDGENIELNPDDEQTNNEEDTEEPSVYNETIKGESLEETLEKQEHTQISIDGIFDTLVQNPFNVVLPNNRDKIFEVKQVDYAFTISNEGNVVSYLDMTPTNEEHIDGVKIYATGHLSNDYLLILVHKNYDFGDFYILDKNFQIRESGKYEKEFEPTITIDGIYFGAVNCNGKRSDKTTGPIVNIYKFETKKGTKSQRYSIDYNGKMNKCS